MNLSVKILFLLLLLFIIGIVLIIFNLPIFVSVPIFIISFLAVIVAVFYFLLKPLDMLYNAVMTINFESDIIDFTEVDSLKQKGYSEIKKMTAKFQVLVDVIAKRIDSVNSATYKSEHDALSGCYNTMRLDRFKTSYEVANSVFIIFIDVNNLKRMNDEFGHEAGDRLIRDAATHLKKWSKYGDVYRVGGDEFMIVLTDRSHETCLKMLNSWYPSVGRLNKTSDGFSCVLSYGTSFGTKGCNFDALRKEADDKMYQMKVRIKKELGEPMR